MGILLSADDVALLSETEDTLQHLLKTCCYRCRLLIHRSETQMNHFRTKGVPSRRKMLTLGTVTLEYTPEYKYVGSSLDEFVTHEAGVK